ncbi:hypothetical protein [Parvularcula oceani]|uniref:hypothetical protein n=1 Tax=Parvularcula oceani TaxID=1247963 RepID=UPI0004E0D399|nr:hypothetical protein [Parvularcula oceani]
MENTLSLSLDLTLIGTCACTLLYCWRLSRRLKAMHSLKGGVSRAIVDLSDAIKASQAASQGISRAAQEAVETLDAAHAQLASRRQETEDLIGVLEGQGRQAESRMVETQEAAEKSLAVIASKARVELEALSEAVGIAEKITALVADPEVPVQHVRQRAAEGPNPFLRAVAS